MESLDATGIPKVLVVDDEPAMRRAFVRLLNNAGYDTVEAVDGGDAVAAIRKGEFDAVISDISMPGTGGIDLLRYVRLTDPELPVVLVTGAPAVETAVQALDHGAFKYLLKPVDAPVLLETTNKAVQMCRMARIRRDAAELTEGSAQDDPELRHAFETTLAEMRMAYQPIVGRDGTLYGYEALMRVKHPSIRHPGEMLSAAEKLGELKALGRHTRGISVVPMENVPDTQLFVNLHPQDLLDEELLAPDAPLTKMASQVVLEITERETVSNVQQLRDIVGQLKNLGYRIAIDDLGAGYAGLNSFALLEPDIVKLDMALVRDVDTSAVKQRVIRSLTALCSDMNIKVVGEGVETLAERNSLIELGCDLLQGYLIAKPAPPFPEITWT